MNDPLRARLGVDVQELNGATISGEIPLTATLINRVIANWLERNGRAGKLAAVVVEPLDEGRLSVNVRLRSALLPPLRLDLQIAGQPELPASPVLVLRWSVAGGLGPLARLASPALTVFDVLPPGVRVDGDLLGVDIGELLRIQKAEWVLTYLRTVQVRTQTGRVVVQLSAAV